MSAGREEYYSPVVPLLDEVQILLLGILRRFKQRHKLFRPLAMQTVSVEMNHIIQKGLCPQPGLEIFLLGAFANMIDSKPHRDQSLRLAGGGFHKEEDTNARPWQTS